MIPQRNVLCCHKCGHDLVPFEWLCLCKYSKATHCTLKYDHQIKYCSEPSFELDEQHAKTLNLMNVMTIQQPLKKKTMHTLHCKQCSEKMATVIKIQDEYKDVDGKLQQFSEGFVCFRPEATFVKGLEQSDATKGKKWPERNLSFDLCDISSYFPQVTTSQDNDSPHQEILEPIIQTYLPILKDENNEEHYPSELLKSQPRDYQIEMYFQSLFTNSIICLPTGLGKTLVSVLLIKKMCELNPDKLVAFVVNKIPLAFQQSEYYNRETGHLSLVLCSQTRNVQDIEKLHNRHTQVCFFTDGLLLNLLENKMLRPEDFAMVVFDEIHHGCGTNSTYNTLATAFRNSKTSVKITGLTASPIDFTKLECTFGINTVSYPSITRENMEEIANPATTKIKKTSMKQEQINMIDLLRNEILLLNEQLKEYKVVNLWNFGGFQSVVGYLRNHIPSKYQEISLRILKIIPLIETTEILGTKETVELLKSEITLEKISEKVSSIKESYSERFGVLESILNKTPVDSRILIFVKTKDMSFRLTRMLQRKFQKFYPKRIVGQYGVGGMNYEIEQKLLIDEFKSNECKLLVSTSVLEEGIDISDCNSVILFDGSLSLRRIVQARGRARKKNSTFYLLIGTDEEDYYKKIENEEKEMIKIISERSKSSSNNIETLLKEYLTYRETIKPTVTKTLSFTIHHFDTVSAQDIRNTMSKLKRVFKLLEWDKKSTHIEMDLVESKFDSVRKNIFETILKEHKCVFIEPNESLHSFSDENEACYKGAMVLSHNRGFEFYSTDEVMPSLPEEFILHNKILRAVGDYVLLDENSGKFIVNSKSPTNEKELNKFSYLFTNSKPGTCIPKRFEQFKLLKVYYISLNPPETVSSKEAFIHENFTISYYLSYIQDRHPMVYMTPQTIKTIKEGFEYLLTTESFSENALSMSSFVVDVCKVLEKCPFATESIIIEYIKALPKPKRLTPITLKNRFIRCFTYCEKNKRTTTVELPQLVDDKRFFRKLGIDDFIKVKIIDTVPSTSIVCCGKEYCPLGGSLSMLRSNYVFFFDKSKFESANTIMSIFGTYVDTSFKIISRHALNFTTTKETCKINKWKCVKDLVAMDETITSDGIGKISLRMATEISDKLGLPCVPTAFQIRFLGFKGVLTVLPDDDMEGMEVIVRKSMRKFEGEGEFDKLEIVSWTSPHRSANLNKQIILLLLSLGISSEVFLSIFLDYFRDLSNQFTNPKYFLQILKDNCIDTLPALQSLDEMPNDEFLFNVAKKLTYESIKKVQSKAMIPIEKALIAMSIVDEYQKLEENEVMIQLGNGQYLNDGTKVFICRNPCLHPSDIQIFTARNHEVLRSKYTSSSAAVIFPTKCFSATKICDFDGDRVFVCWDERLVPDHVSNLYPSNPMDNNNHEMFTDLCDILSKILDNGGLLGKISDGWVAVTDSEGATSDKALYLADLFVAAVDYPKTGKSITLPNWFKDILYPDFMERDSNCIKSNSILGRIYHRCTAIKNDIPADFTEPEHRIENKKVKEWHDRFWKIVEYLKQVHNCTLYDLVSGDGKARKEFTQLIEQFREIAREEDCRQAIQSLPISNIFSLIIPSRKIAYYMPLNIHKKLETSLSTFLDTMPLEQLEMMEKRMERIKEKTNQKLIHMFGSIPILLHHTIRTDCDVFINFTAGKGDENPPPESSILSKEFESNATDWQKSIPMFRIFVKSNDIPFIESIDFTNSSRGLRKKHHLRLYLKKKPKLIILLKVLIEILRKACPQIKTYQLIWKIIEFCVKKNYLTKLEAATEQFSLEHEMEKDSVFMRGILSKCLNTDFCCEVELILDFLKSFNLQEKMEFVDNLDESKITHVTMDFEQSVRSQDMIDSCLINLYLLQDFSKLNIQEKEEVQVYLPNLLRKILGNVMIVKHELEKSCNCTITNIINTNGDNYIINATGEHGVGNRLKQKLALWNTNCKYFRARNQRLFLDGSTSTIFMGDSFNCPIEFVPHQGKCNPKHADEFITKHCPKLKDYREEIEFPIYNFYEQLKNQLLKMLALDYDTRHFAYSVKFGKYYVINYEKSIFSEITPQDSQHYNTLMKKNHFKSFEKMKKENERKEKIIISQQEEPNNSHSSSSEVQHRKFNNSNNQHNSKTDKSSTKPKEKKAPSDSLITFVELDNIREIEKFLEGCVNHNVVTEYSVCIIKNNTFEHKIKLDENLKFKKMDGIRSYHTRIMATTFIGKTNDMRFYINHSQYLPETDEMYKLVNRLSENEWIIKEESPQSPHLIYHKDIPLINIVRKVEKHIYNTEYNNQQVDLTIHKVSLYTKQSSSPDQTLLDLSSEHYEFKIALPKSDRVYSPFECMALLNVGIHFWNIMNKKQQ